MIPSALPRRRNDEKDEIVPRGLYLWRGLLLALMLGVMFAEYLIPWDAYAQDLSMA